MTTGLYKIITIHFRKRDDNLYQYVVGLSPDGISISHNGRVAFECLRLCTRVLGDDWRVQLEAIEAGKELAK